MYKIKKIGIIIQARYGSTRLPGKVLKNISGFTMLDWVIYRCGLSRNVKEIVLATSNLIQDDSVAEIGENSGIGVFRGSEIDVLERYVQAAEWAGFDVVVRITADCPLIDPIIIDQAVSIYQESSADYIYIDGYPNGLGAAEILSLSSLKKVMSETAPDELYYREHVMTYITENGTRFLINIQKAPEGLNHPEIRLCVDEKEDLDLVRIVCKKFFPRRDFTTAEIIGFLHDYPEYGQINRHIKQKTKNDCL